MKKQIDERWNSLTKPPGSLGRLEGLVTRYALIRGEVMPALERKGMYLFCGDHGVAAEGVSAFPQEVTQQMVINFARGGAAISVLCRRFGIQPVVVDVGVKGEIDSGVVDRKIAAGTKNFCVEPAMTRDEAERALRVGEDLARDAAERFDIAGLGEMGIANSTPAAALLSVFTGLDPAETVGRGTGIGKDGLARKVDAVRRGLTLHQPDPKDPVGALSAVGGFEIGATTGFILGAAEAGLPVVLDGFISTSAALLAKAIKPESLDAVIYSHRSAEQGHGRMLGFLDAETYLALGMRLGEGTGAALTINLLETGLAVYREMATFTEAGVST